MLKNNKADKQLAYQPCITASYYSVVLQRHCFYFSNIILIFLTTNHEGQSLN